MKTKLNWFDRLMMGVTFAEANMPVAARELAAGTKGRDVKCRDREQSKHEQVEEHEIHTGAAKI